MNLHNEPLRHRSWAHICLIPSGGAGPRGVLPTLSQYMLGSAATFSFFLAIGSVRVFSLYDLDLH